MSTPQATAPIAHHALCSARRTSCAGEPARLGLFPSTRVTPDSNSSPDARLDVSIAKSANRLFCRTFHRVTTFSPPRLPRSGPAILVCNHVSGLDPLLIQSSIPRLVIWMMAQEYYDMKSLTWLYKIVEAIPVQRSGRDTAATRGALRALAHGRIVGIFPEGKIETSRDLLPFQTGVAMIAIKQKVPVYPAYLDGTQRGKEMVDAVVRPNQATLRFGPPVEFPRDSTTKEALEHATAQIRAAVQKLKDETEACSRKEHR